jgi:hypothetical protein
MARVQVGVTCPNNHFNPFTHVWEPAKDKDIDKLAERSAMPATCETCGADILTLPHIEGREREAETLARRGGQNVRTPLQSRTKPKPKEGPLNPLEWKRRVFDRQRTRPGGPALCAVTGEPLSFHVDEVHHPLEKTFLRERGLHMHVWDERNGMAVKRAIHNGHTNRSRPIRRSFVPASAFQFARELGPWAVARINEKHPK